MERHLQVRCAGQHQGGAACVCKQGHLVRSGTVTDGVKGIICDVRACAFYKDPLCTEGPDARIRPIAIGGADTFPESSVSKRA